MFLPKEGLADLIEALKVQEYTVIAPVLRDNAIKLQPIIGVDQIARGLRDDQDGGHYRLGKGDPELFFENSVGPDSAKYYFFPPHHELYAIDLRQGRFAPEQTRAPAPRLALLGLRPCDLAAIRVQDIVFSGAAGNSARCEAETYYIRTRARSVLIAVNCTRPGGTCFCDSMKTGPEAKEGFDVVMTELRNGFILSAGSETGATLLEKLPLREPVSAELELAELKIDRARNSMGRKLDTHGLVEALGSRIEHPRWDKVARRCLSCGNCTMVCPTCFCSTVVDSSGLDTRRVTRSRHWESCYTHQFSYTTTGPHRNTIRGRYRHWLRHKLCTWWEQFGTSGCIGCGRCITWCPVGIDLTEESAAIMSGEPPGDSISTAFTLEMRGET